MVRAWVRAVTMDRGCRGCLATEDGTTLRPGLFFVLREWRGGLHLNATTAMGLGPVEAILTNEGKGQARGFGWTGPFPDCSG